MANLVTSPAGACYPWSYIVAENPIRCHETMARKAQDAACPWWNEIKILSEKLVHSGVKISFMTLVNAIGIAILSKGNERVFNYRGNRLQLPHSMITLVEKDCKRLFITYARTNVGGAYVKVSSVVSICLPYKDPEELRYETLVKLSLDYTPYRDEQSKEGTPSVYRRISLDQQLAEENEGVKLYATVQADTIKGRRKFYLFQEQGKDLESMHKTFALLPIEEKLRYAVGAAAALWRLHEKGIVHNDVKTSNYLAMKNGEVKVIDLGFSRKKGDPFWFDCSLGTYPYSAPEQLEHCVDCIKVKKRDPFGWDNFGLGLTLHSLLVGREHEWYYLAAQYEGFRNYLNGTEKWTHEAIFKTFELCLERDTLEKKLSVEAAQSRNTLERSYMSIINSLMDPNPRTRMKSKEAYEQLAALLNSK